MNEALPSKALIGERAGQRGRTRRDHLGDVDSGTFDLAHKTQQTFVAGVRSRSSLAFVQPAIVAVVVVEAAEIQPGIPYRTNKLKNLVAMTLLNSRAIHARIDVEKHSDRTALPLQNLLLILGQNRDAHMRKRIRNLAHAPGVRAYGWISKEHIGSAGAAGLKQFQRGRALEIADPAVDQHSQGIIQLCGLDMHPPAICVAS